ncbi:MAG: glycosyltransferase family 39 protein, partial [Anaerolineaceae bacterium]
SFQPDPLMVALALFGLDAIDRYAQQPAWKAAITAGLWMGAAILVKQVMVFLLPAALILAVWRDNGFRRLLRDTRMWAMGILALLPAALYNLYGVFVSGTLAGQYAQRFFPNLWIDPGFYIRWSRMIADTLGLPVFLLALAGILLLPRSGMKSMWIGYGIGYLLYGFIFAHHISTHDYYQLPLFPLAAAGAGSALGSLWAAIRQINPGRLGMAAAASVLLAAGLLSVYETRSALNRVDYRADGALLADLADRMGGPRTKIIGLTGDYGAALNYYGFLLPAYWEAQQNGTPLAALSERELEQTLLERVQGKSYLFISDLDALNSQPLVRRFLDTHYELFYQDARYLIYDLKKSPQQTGQVQDMMISAFSPFGKQLSGARS